MSNPPNRLADYRTYAYHHILIVCDGMNTANELSSSSNLTLFNRPNVQPASRYRPRFLEPGNKNGYVTLIDGMQDVTFFIESVKWETIIAPSGTAGGSKRATTLEVDGEITIIEPIGVKFLEVLTNVGSELGTDPSGFIFLLKTIFVGHKDDGSQDVISDVRPFIFTMIDIKAVMEASGTTYNLTLVGVNNGTAKLPQIARMADGLNLYIPRGSTIKAAMELFFVELNNKYDEFKKEFNDQLQAAKSTINVTDDFRSVRYEVNIDDNSPYASYVAAENNVTIESDRPDDAMLGSGANSTIENFMKKIMDSSTAVMNDASKKNPEKKRFLYKIVSTILPDFVGDDMVVEYSVHRYEEITQRPKVPLEPIAGEFIEFNYMFTGKNVDVLEFDIKMDMGMSFFQTVATATSNISGDNLSADNKTKVVAGPGLFTTAKEVLEGVVVPATANNNPSIALALPVVGSQKPPQATEKKIKTPLFLGTTIKDPVIRNKRNPLESATFDALLARHAAYENVECAMKISGNPQLLDESCPIPTEVSQGGIVHPDFPPEKSKTGLQSMFTTPALIKVNVKFPSDNELTGVDDFWYKGFYNLYSITQNFDSGLFTQDILMFSLPVEDDDDIENKMSSRAKVPFAPNSTRPEDQFSGIQEANDAYLARAEKANMSEPAPERVFTGNQSVKGNPGLSPAELAQGLGED